MDIPRNASTMEDELDYLFSQVSDSDLHELLADDSAQLHHQALSAGAPLQPRQFSPTPFSLAATTAKVDSLPLKQMPTLKLPRLVPHHSTQQNPLTGLSKFGENGQHIDESIVML